MTPPTFQCNVSVHIQNLYIHIVMCTTVLYKNCTVLFSNWKKQIQNLFIKGKGFKKGFNFSNAKN